MNLHEYQSKRIFASNGIPSPWAKWPRRRRRYATLPFALGKPVVVKAQVLVGGRGKAGGIKVAQTPDDAEQKAEAILGMNIKGLTVKKVLVDEASTSRRRSTSAQYWIEPAAASFDGQQRRRRRDRAGCRQAPDQIVTVAVHPFLGLRDHQARILADGIGLPREQCDRVHPHRQGLYRSLYGHRRQPCAKSTRS